MISYLKGEIIDVLVDSLILETNQIGYQIYVPASVVMQLPSIGSDIKIHTHFHVREDALTLYGFLTKDDLSVFKLLIGVSGIGPKGALGILSTISPDELRFAVLAEDVKTITKAPGIGNKTAQKLIIELKDKLKLEDIFEQKEQTELAPGLVKEDIRNEAIQALIALGYSGTDALRAVKQIPLDENTTVEELLKAALKKISFM
ncbi:MAG: Holliday junction branch migration protein RuvA [Clostridiales bacterium]|nr:Holliday junction branch migration protein RuvA [Clostridiales bacterium]